MTPHVHDGTSVRLDVNQEITNVIQTPMFSRGKSGGQGVGDSMALIEASDRNRYRAVAHPWAVQGSR